MYGKALSYMDTSHVRELITFLSTLILKTQLIETLIHICRDCVHFLGNYPSNNSIRLFPGNPFFRV